MNYMKIKKGFYVSLVLTGLLLIIIGATKSDVYRSIARSQRIFNEVYKQLIINYADELNTDSFTKSSINNMLSDLDPYTNYLEFEERDALDLLTHGKYGGIGIQLGERNEKLIVISPMENSPAKNAGILSGDIIIRIDEEETSEMNLNDAAQKIRGDTGTIVVLTVQRPGVEEAIDFRLTRSDIIVQDVMFAEMIDQNTGYIVLTRFSTNAPQEMKDALETLIDQDISHLILDLRNNPGGLLASAIAILDMMVAKGEQLLWTKGRNKESNRNFISKEKPILSNDINLIVLINEGSASASEIVAGAIQDLDRGVVIGKRSFGKGLVQSVYPIDQKRSLKVTTAKYFIPSGRLIQNPDYLKESVVNQPETLALDTVFTTKSGRVVKGGGGIYPDYIVETNKIGPLVQECWLKSYFFTFAHENKNDFASFEEVLMDDTIMERFIDYLKTQDLDVKIDGQPQYEKAREKLTAQLPESSDLNGAFGIIDKFISQKKVDLFSEEYDELARGLFTNYAQIFEIDKGKIRYNIKYDEHISKAIELFNDQIVFNETFLSETAN